MIIKKTFISFLRWGLRIHSLLHILEFGSAIYEGAYITAVIAFFVGAIEILSSFLLPDEHIHFKGLTTEVHSDCEDK